MSSVELRGGRVIGWIAVALLGAVVCTIGDHLHVITGVLSYPKVAFWQEAWWVPLLFACASVVLIWNAQPVRHVLHGAVLPQPTVLQLFGDTLGFFTAYAYTAYGHGQPTLVLLVLSGFFVARALD